MFNDNLAMLRKQAGVSQAELAAAIGVSRQAVSKYENGTAEPDIAKLTQLKQYFDVSFDQLLDGVQPHVSQSPQTVVNGKIMIKTASGRLASFSGFRIGTNITLKKKQRVALIGDSDVVTFFGLEQLVLGLYASRRDAEREIESIQSAMQNGVASYELQFTQVN
jgi:transcriptional regulator with XRE-family HTH domain